MSQSFPQAVVEILSYSVSQGLVLKDPTLGFVQMVVDYLEGMEGCLGVLRGLQEEKKTQMTIIIDALDGLLLASPTRRRPTSNLADIFHSYTAHAFLGWESYAHYKKTTERADYASFIPSSLRPNLEESIKVQIVQFDVYPSVAFSAPITEFVTFQMKEAIDALQRGEKMVAHIKSLGDAPIGGASRVGRYLPMSCGSDVEEQGVYVLAVGWESTKVHKEYIKAFVSTADQEKENEVYSGVAAIDIRHVALTG